MPNKKKDGTNKTKAKDVIETIKKTMDEMGLEYDFKKGLNLFCSALDHDGMDFGFFATVRPTNFNLLFVHEIDESVSGSKEFFRTLNTLN